MEWAKTLIDLGNLGAALFIIYMVTKMLFRYLEGRGKSDSSGINKLCDRIDKLIDSFHGSNLRMNEILNHLANDRDSIKEQYNTVLMRVEAIEKHLSKVASDLFQAFREHEQHSSDTYNELSASLDGLDVKVVEHKDVIISELKRARDHMNTELVNLKENCKIQNGGG